MKNIFFCGKDVGLKSLKWLHKKNYKPYFVVIDSKSESKIIQYCKINKFKYKVLNKNKIDKYFAKFKRSEFDWLISLWNPSIISQRTLEKFKNTINLHPSYIPYCKGSDTAAWIIRTGSVAGVALNEMSKKVDEGKVWIRKKVSYKLPITGKELQIILKKELLKLFFENWKKIVNKRLKSKKISLKGTKFTRKKTNLDKHLIFSEKNEISQAIKWLLAHDFGKISKASISFNKKEYSVSLKLEKK